jgi:hypothetical protein
VARERLIEIKNSSTPIMNWRRMKKSEIKLIKNERCNL